MPKIRAVTPDRPIHTFEPCLRSEVQARSYRSGYRQRTESPVLARSPTAQECQMMLRASDSFDAVILGAGVVGVSSAYWLARAGKHVCLIDRQPAAGLETTFANGGQISVSHAEPWANPSAPIKVLKWLFDDNAPLLFRPKLDVHQWLWIAEFLVNCLPHRSSRHTAELVKLGTASRDLLREIRNREGIIYDQQSRGIIHFYRDQQEFDAAIPVAELMRQYGCDRR